MENLIQLLLASLLGGGTVAAVLAAAAETRMRKVFVPREDFDGFKGHFREKQTEVKDRLDYKAKKIERNVNLFVSLEDRVGDLEQKTALIEERQTHQWERISERMAATALTIERVAKEMEEVGKTQNRLALELERRHQSRKEYP